MSTQRSSRRSRPSRRAVLGAVAGVAATGGCVGSVVRAGAEGSGGVSVLVAGSLQRTFERLRERVDPAVRVEAHGSVTVARLVAEGQRDPDLVALADTGLFDAPLSAPWYATVATNALVVAHAESDGGRRVAGADRWFDPVLAGAASLGRTDPDLDPLGYRTLFALELAEGYYDRPGLREAVLDPGQVYPETSLMSRFETGELDAAVVYRNMALERGYASRDLPAAVDLSDPDRDGEYAAASYTLPGGRTVRGEHVAYGATARSDDAATRAVFDALIDGGVLVEGSFEVPERFPVYEGEVPRGYR